MRQPRAVWVELRANQTSQPVPSRSDRMHPKNRLRNGMASPSSRRALFQAVAGGLVMLVASPGVIRQDRVVAQSPGAPAPDKTPAYAGVLDLTLAQLCHELLIPGAAVLVQSPQLGDWATT